MNPFKRYSSKPEAIRKARARRENSEVHFIIDGKIIAIGDLAGVKISTQDVYLKIDNELA